MIGALLRVAAITVVGTGMAVCAGALAVAALAAASTRFPFAAAVLARLAHPSGSEGDRHRDA